MSSQLDLRLLLLGFCPQPARRCSWSFQLVWQPRKVCNHSNHLVTSPLISRDCSLDLRTRIGLKETQKACVVSSTMWTQASIGGELNHGINTLSLVFLVFVLLSTCLFVILGFGPDLQIGGSLRSRKHLDNILPLGSGVVSYWLHKVHLSTCSSFQQASEVLTCFIIFDNVRSSNLNCHNFRYSLTSDFELCRNFQIRLLTPPLQVISRSLHSLPLKTCKDSIFTNCHPI